MEEEVWKEYIHDNKDQVIEIRQKYDSGEMTKDELAIKYDISLSTINSVINRKTWKHI